MTSKVSVEGALPMKIISVPHLGGTKISYHLPKPVVGSKATLVLIPSYLSSANQFRPQIADEGLNEVANLLAVEPLGHGQSSTRSVNYTNWDSAVAILQVLDSLGVKKAFILGNSMGAWIGARVALLAPERVSGFISISGYLGPDSPKIQELGGIDLTSGIKETLPKISAANENFELPSDLPGNLLKLAMGSHISEDQTRVLTEVLKKNYAGETGRQKFRQASINLVERDSLYLRLGDLTAPTLWITGAEDTIFPEAVTKEEISKLTASEVTHKAVPGALHTPTFTHPAETNPIIVDFITKYSGVKNARALREAVGMVDM